ncbi:MAG: energy transducer TonB, partial [Calditrichia bacterium]|nr:energy transducer TonB [Calditrichia bacterium]
RTALASVKNWSFEPGMRGDEKVEMWVKVPIRFQLK